MSAGTAIRTIWLSYIAGRKLELPQPLVSRIIFTFECVMQRPAFCAVYDRV